MVVYTSVVSKCLDKLLMTYACVMYSHRPFLLYWDFHHGIVDDCNSCVDHRDEWCPMGGGKVRVESVEVMMLEGGGGGHQPPCGPFS